MKKFKLLLLIALIAMLLPGSTLFAQWSQTNGPVGGAVSCVASKDSKIFAGTEEGIFISNNSGTSWFPSNTGISAFDYRAVSELMVKDNDMIAVVYNKLYKSADNGNVWSALSMTGVPNTSAILALTYNSSYMYASFGKVYRSADNGNTWSVLTSGLPSNVIVTALAASGSMIYAGTVSHGIFVSSDNGNTWSAHNIGISSYYIPSITIHGQVLHCATFSGGVFTSQIGGSSWTPMNNGFPNSNSEYVQGLNRFSNAIFAITGNGVFKSVDNAVSWQYSGTGLPNYVYSVTGSGANYFAATVAGVYKSQDGGTTWTEANQNLISTHATKLAAKDNKLFATIDNKGIARSLNSGVTWDYLSNGISPTGTYTNVVISGSNIITIPEAVSGNGQGLLISTNDGDSFSQITNGISSGALVGALTTEGNNVYGSVGRKVIVSTNNGAIFTSGSNVFNTPYDIVLGLAASSTHLYAATSTGLFISQDKGITWDSIEAAFPEHQSLRAFAYNDGKLYMSGFNSGAKYSTDNGTTWITMNSMPNSVIYTFSFYQNKIFAGSDIGVMVSANNGQSWQVVNNGLTFNALKVTALIKSNTDHLFISTYASGVWKSFAPDFVITEVGNAHSIISPRDYSLGQNYPNPFNPSTQISYQLLKAGFVSMKVYDLSGKEVAVMVNEMKNEGSHSVTFDGTKLSSGIYFYTIETEGFSATKKMILVK